METVSDMIAGFLAGLTPGTRAGYRSIVSRWLRWCSDNGIDMLRAKRTHIEVFAAYDGGMRPAAKNTLEPNNAVLRNPLDVDSTFHIRIYDYFIDFHEDREIVDDLEFTPSDVDADDWTEDIKRCLEENGWRLDSKIGTDSDDSDLLVFDCVKA